MKALIIDTPSMQSLKQRSTSSLLLFAFWLFWFYLWTPALTFVCWYAGFNVLNFEIIVLNQYDNFIDTLCFFGKTLIFFGLAFVSWMTYNYYRFRHVKRRVKAYHTDTNQLMKHFNVNEFTLLEYQASRYISLNFDKDGNIMSHRSAMLIDDPVYILVK